MANATLETCQICLDDVDSSKLSKQICSESCQGQICSDCLQQHFHSIIGCGYDGTCPLMRCPSCPKRIVTERRWRSWVDPRYAELFRSRAKKLLSLQCASCHTRQDIFEQPPAHEGTSEEHKSELEQGLSPIHLKQLDPLLSLYKTNEIDQNELYARLEKEFAPQFTLPKERESELFNNFIRPVLWLLAADDFERTASLHLRHLRSFPRAISTCCKHTHCFRCRIGGFHDDLTCDQYQALNRRDAYEDMVTCAQCNLHLVKGDGCSYVTCYCGFGFDYNTRVREMSVVRFETDHGDDAGRYAAFLLYTHETDSPGEGAELHRIAVQYGQSKPEELKEGRAQLWAQLHPHHTVYHAEQCLRSPPSGKDQELAQTWVDKHPDQVAKRQAASKAANLKAAAAIARKLRMSEIAMLIRCPRLHPQLSNMLQNYVHSYPFFAYCLTMTHRVREAKREQYFSSVGRATTSKVSPLHSFAAVTSNRFSLLKARKTLLESIRKTGIFTIQFQEKATSSRATRIVKEYEGCVFFQPATNGPDATVPVPTAHTRCLEKLEKKLANTRGLNSKDRRNHRRAALERARARCRGCGAQQTLLACQSNFCGPTCGGAVCRGCATAWRAAAAAAVGSAAAAGAGPGAASAALFPPRPPCPGCGAAGYPRAALEAAVPAEVWATVAAQERQGRRLAESAALFLATRGKHAEKPLPKAASKTVDGRVHCPLPLSRSWASECEASDNNSKARTSKSAGRVRTAHGSTQQQREDEVARWDRIAAQRRMVPEYDNAELEPASRGGCGGWGWDGPFSVAAISGGDKSAAAAASAHPTECVAQRAERRSSLRKAAEPRRRRRRR